MHGALVVSTAIMRLVFTMYYHWYVRSSFVPNASLNLSIYSMLRFLDSQCRFFATHLIDIVQSHLSFFTEIILALRLTTGSGIHEMQPLFFEI